MAAITIRNLSTEAHAALKKTARRHGRSMEAEARTILEQRAQAGEFMGSWLRAAEELRGDDLPAPDREQGRPAPDFS